MRYHNITKDDMKNGDGLRVVLWLAGCNHCCKGCQNPVTWDKDSGLLFDEKAEAEIYDQLDKEYISGLTLSGGDPMFLPNRVEVRELVKRVKEKYPDKTIWMYTGDSWEDIYNDSVMNYIDVCVDGEFHLDERDITLMWKGSKNQRVINVKSTLNTGNPLVPVLHCLDHERVYEGAADTPTQSSCCS